MKIIYIILGLLAALSLSAAPPTTPSTGLYFSIIDGNYFNMGWTRGNGARRIIIAKAGSAVTAVPENGKDYNENSIFGQGDMLAPGEFVIYDNTSTSFYLTGLTGNTTYHFAIYEYNGSGFGTEYLATPLRGSQATPSTPTVQASALVFSNITATSALASWTVGNGYKRLVLVREGSAVNANPVDYNTYGSGAFGSGGQVGTGNYSVYTNTGNSTTITNLKPGTTYHLAIYEYNGNGEPLYLSPGYTSSFTTGTKPTIPSSGITQGSRDGKQLAINFTPGNGIRRIVIAKKGSAVTAVPSDGTDYTDNSIFGSGDAIAPGEYVIYDGTANSNIPVTGLDPFSTYYFRVFDYVGSGASTGYLTSSFASGSASTATAPTVQVKNISASNLKTDYLYLNFSGGNGVGRIIVARKGEPVNSTPADFTKYNGTGNFGSGDQIGTGNYVLANALGSAINVNNLEPNTTYYFSLYEYNGSEQPVYATPAATFSVTTLARPTIPSSGMYIFNNTEGNSMNIVWSTGNGSKRIVIAKKGSAVTSAPADNVQYTANSTFGSGTMIAQDEYVIFDGNNNGAYAYGLEANTVYHFRVFEYNTVNGDILYLTSSFASGNFSTLKAPTVSASNIVFSNITSTSMTVSWTGGNGTRNLLAGRAQDPVNAQPVFGSSYTASVNFGSGAALAAGNYVIVSGTSQTATITNLQPGTTYHFSVFDYNGLNGPVYLTPGTTGSATTNASISKPTNAATNLTYTEKEGNSLRLNWTNGNGARRIVIAREASATTFIPADGSTYTASATFGSGQNLGNEQYVVYDGTGSYTTISNLKTGTGYYFSIFEYNGTGAGTTYLTSVSTGGNEYTVAAPTVQASFLTSTALTPTQAKIGWTNGNGERRIVVIRAGSPVSAIPANLIAYSANSSFGSNVPITAGNYGVYKGTATNVTVTGLVSGTIYYVAVFEYNGDGAPVYATPALTGSFITVGAPQTAASQILSSNITGSTIQLSWANGNGQRRLVLGRKSAAVSSVPADDVNYTANSAFGSGELIGAGNYVLYNGNGNSITVTNLQGQTTYHFAIYEFNDFGSSIVKYLTLNAPVASATTPIVLPVKLSKWQAGVKDAEIVLQWTTQMEVNSAHFNIQRSTDGIRFNTIAKVNASGSSQVPVQYIFNDTQPANGKNYYRLQMVDKDGAFEYSLVASVSFIKAPAIRILNNPVQDYLVVNFISGNNGSRQEWRITDASGRVLKSGKIISERLEINVTSLGAGNYWLSVQSGTELVTKPFIKH